MYSPGNASPPSSDDAWLDALTLGPLPADAKPVAFLGPSPPGSPSSAAGLGSPHRKRQRPLFADMKLEFAGFEVAAPDAAAAAAFFPDTKADELLHERAADFFAALRLPLAQDPAALPAAVDALQRQGFDTTAALAFASPDELQRAGLSPADVSVVVPAARQRFAAALALPPPLAPHVTVAQWLASCGVPSASALVYAERLARLGYAHTLELELALHDSRAVSQLALGHGRLFLHCVAAAVHSLQLQQQQQQQQHNFLLAQQQPIMFAAGSSSAMLQPVDLQRESELDALIHDGFLDALMDPAPDAAVSVSQPMHMAAGHDMTGDALLKGPATASAAGVSGFSLGGPASAGALRLPPQDVVSLLYEAVNLPRPNPCRRGKKVYWSVLATNGMKDPRFARLAAYSAAELQNAYLRQFELPAGYTSTPTAASSAAAAAVAAASASASASASGKSDAWSEENIKQLERAVKDPRCRHLSKVCWEMLATGRTGVDEYAPLAKFSASQLRSRFRSLFGDKRPQKLRQKKQMLKVQQLQLQQQQQQQQQQHQQTADAVKKELVLL